MEVELKRNKTKEDGTDHAVIQADQEKLMEPITPVIDRIIRKLGAHPGQPCWGMDYDDLFSEAHWLIYFRILPRFNGNHGKFENYACSYLKRELKKRLMRSRKHMEREIPFSTLFPEQSNGNNNGDSNGYPIDNYFGTSDNGLKQAEIRISLEKVADEATAVEVLFLKDLKTNGKFSPLREIEQQTGIDHVTLSRRRKKLAQKILFAL